MSSNSSSACTADAAQFFGVSVNNSSACTVADAAQFFGVSVKTVRRWISDGYLQAERVGPRLIRVDLSSMKTRPLQYMAVNS